MSSAFFPLDAVLTPDVMNERLNRYAKELHAVEVWRKPAEDARYRILAKANIGTSEFPTDAGAEALRNLMLPDAPCVNLLRKVGCDVFGKTAMTELAGFLTTQNSHLGYSHMGGFPKNPHGDFAPRGSSSGSAVAVAAGLCDAALGTETRGSLMLPGIANGVVSYKPTRGLISRTRIVPISHHFDAPGVIARSVDAAATVAQLMMGEDPEDPETLRVGRLMGVVSEVGKSVTEGRRLRLAVLGGEEAVAFLLKWLHEAADLIPAPLDEPDFNYKLITSLDIRNDMDDLLGRYAGVETPHSFAELCEYYRSHPDARPFGMDRLDDALAMTMLPRDEIDRIAAESIGRAKARIDELLVQTQADAMVSTSFVDWWSISGAPSMTVPIGKEKSGKPVGLLLGTSFGDDAGLIKAARTVEAARTAA